MTTDFQQDIERCLKTLRAGGLILYPTDTIWGIGCDATNPEAILKIFTLKKRVEGKSLIILVATEKELGRYIVFPHPGVPAWLRQNDKPVTVIYEGAIGLPESLMGPGGTVAIRVVREPFCKTLIRRYGKPIVSTSANISGEYPPGNFSEISSAIIHGVDYTVKYRRDDLELRSASTLVKFDREGKIITLRS